MADDNTTCTIEEPCGIVECVSDCGYDRCPNDGLCTFIWLMIILLFLKLLD